MLLTKIWMFFLGKASRFCDKDDGWQKPSLLDCVSNSFLALQKQVNEMNYSAFLLFSCPIFAKTISHRQNPVNRVSKVTFSLPYRDSSFEICHLSYKKGTGAEMRPANVSGNAPVSYWPIFSLSLVTIPEILAKVSSPQFFSRYLSGGLNRFALINKQIELLFPQERLISPKKPCE